MEGMTVLRSVCLILDLRFFVVVVAVFQCCGREMGGEGGKDRNQLANFAGKRALFSQALAV